MFEILWTLLIHVVKDENFSCVYCGVVFFYFSHGVQKSTDEKKKLNLKNAEKPPVEIMSVTLPTLQPEVIPDLKSHLNGSFQALFSFASYMNRQNMYKLIIMRPVSVWVVLYIFKQTLPDNIELH